MECEKIFLELKKLSEKAAPQQNSNTMEIPQSLTQKANQTGRLPNIGGLKSKTAPKRAFNLSTMDANNSFQMAQRSS